MKWLGRSFTVLKSKFLMKSQNRRLDCANGGRVDDSAVDEAEGTKYTEPA